MSTIPTESIHAYLARHQRKELLRFLTCDSVDDGESTLIRRHLQHGMIFSRIHKPFNFSTNLSRQEVDVAVMKPPHRNKIILNHRRFNSRQQYYSGVPQKQHIICKPRYVGLLINSFHPDQRINEMLLPITIAMKHPVHVQDLPGSAALLMPISIFVPRTALHVYRVKAEVNSLHASLRSSNLLVQPGLGQQDITHKTRYRNSVPCGRRVLAAAQFKNLAPLVAGFPLRLVSCHESIDEFLPRYLPCCLISPLLFL